MKLATCRNCARTITLHPTGAWCGGDTERGLYCQEPASPDSPKIKHEPMPDGLKGAPWVE